MAASERTRLPFLIAGGGIGGLAAACALARKGFPVRVLEQAPEFKEIGAGIQLGPNIFRALDKIGLRDAVLADAHVPPAMEMRCALSGDLVTRIPLDDPRFLERFKQPYAVTHRADIHAAILKACLNDNRVTLETSRTVESFEQDADGVTVVLQSGERIRGRALIGCDGMWSKIRDRIVGDGKPRVSGHIAYRAVLKKDEVPPDLWRPDVVLWAGPRTHLVHYPLRRGELWNIVAVFHSDRYVEGWNAEADAGRAVGAFQGAAAGSAAHARAHRDLAHVGAVRPRAGQGMVQGARRAARRCRAPDAAISRAGCGDGDRGRGLAGREGRRAARRSAGGASPPMCSSAICAPRACRSWRASTAISIMRAGPPRSCASRCSARARRRNPMTGSPGSMAACERRKLRDIRSAPPSRLTSGAPRCANSHVPEIPARRRTIARRAVRRLRQRLAVLPEISEIEGPADPRARDRRHGRAARQRRRAALRREGRRSRRARRISALRPLRLLPRRRFPPVRRDRHAQQARHRALRLDADQPGAVVVGRLQRVPVSASELGLSPRSGQSARRSWRRWRCRSATASSGPTCRARSASANASSSRARDSRGSPASSPPRRPAPTAIIVSGLGTPTDQRRLALAKRLGAHHTINVEEQDLLETVVRHHRRRDGRCRDRLRVGGPWTVVSAIQLARKGGRILIGGRKGAPVPQFDVDILFTRFLSVKGMRGHSYQAVELGLQIIASRKYPLEEMCTHTFDARRRRRGAAHRRRRRQAGRHPLRRRSVAVSRLAPRFVRQSQP